MTRMREEEVTHCSTVQACTKLHGFADKFSRGNTPGSPTRERVTVQCICICGSHYYFSDYGSGPTNQALIGFLGNIDLRVPAGNGRRVQAPLGQDIELFQPLSCCLLLVSSDDDRHLTQLNGQ